MKIKIASLILISLTACASYEYDLLYSTIQIKPSIDPDGKKTFLAIASNKLPSFAKDQTLESFHKQAIPAEMGKSGFCPNGYEIDYTNPITDNYAIIYQGECK